MKVILRQDVENLGKEGGSYEVSPGYFRNFLQPRGLAIEATRGRMKSQQVVLSARNTRQSREADQTKQLANDLGELKLSFPVKVGDQGRMYGSITAQDIADEVAKQKQIKVDRHKIVLGDPLRSTGEHTVTLKLDHGVEAELKVVLVAEASE